MLIDRYAEANLFYFYLRNVFQLSLRPKVAGSIPDYVMEIFIDINPSDRTMDLGSTQPLTGMSTRSIPGG
jgi:hypothetical protein